MTGFVAPGYRRKAGGVYIGCILAAGADNACPVLGCDVTRLHVSLSNPGAFTVEHFSG